MNISEIDFDAYLTSRNAEKATQNKVRDYVSNIVKAAKPVAMKLSDLHTGINKLGPVLTVSTPKGNEQLVYGTSNMEVVPTEGVVFAVTVECDWLTPQGEITDAARRHVAFGATEEEATKLLVAGIARDFRKAILSRVAPAPVATAPLRADDAP